MSDTLERIVCATDFSPASEHALGWAAALARRWGAVVDLVHVLPGPSHNIDELATDVRTLEGVAADEWRARLERAVRDTPACAGVQVRPHVLSGDPAGAIASAADSVGARLIVVGMHGRSALARRVWGSVAQRMMRVARCPVVLVPPPLAAPGDAAAASAWRADDRPLRVLAAVDLGRQAGRVAEAVGDLDRRVPCDVTFLHLYWPQEQIARLGLQGTRNLMAPDPDVIAHLEPQLRAALGGWAAGPHVKVSVRPAWGEPAGNVLLAAHEGDADLIVVGSEERHGFARLLHPAVAVALARHARDVPVMCLPRAPETQAEPAPARQPGISTVLAPTDFSAAGNRAVLYAYALLRGRGGVVELCHVHEHAVPNPPYAYDDLRMRLPPDRRAAIESELRALIPRDAEAQGITTHVSVIEGGEAATAIAQAAERLDADAIAMGSDGRGGLARAVLGSVAESVTRHASKPVLVVRAARR